MVPPQVRLVPPAAGRDVENYGGHDPTPVPPCCLIARAAKGPNLQTQWPPEIQADPSKATTATIEEPKLLIFKDSAIVPRDLFYSHRLCQIARLIDIGALCHRGVIG